MKKLMSHLFAFVVLAGLAAGCSSFGIATKADVSRLESRIGEVSQTSLNAMSKASDAVKAAAGAADAANAANVKSDGAKSAADKAVATAAAAAKSATDAVSAADAAKAVADVAKAVAGGAQAKAGDAVAKADSATTMASAASSAAARAAEDLKKVNGRVAAVVAKATSAHKLAGSMLEDGIEFVHIGPFEYAKLADPEGDEFKRCAGVQATIRGQINALVAKIEAEGSPYVIDGDIVGYADHTDFKLRGSDKPRPDSDELNQRCSQERADKVASMLGKALGSDFKGTGMGKTGKFGGNDRYAVVKLKKL